MLIRLFVSKPAVIEFIKSFRNVKAENNITKDFQAITPINPLIVILGIVVLYAIGIFIFE